MGFDIIKTCHLELKVQSWKYYGHRYGIYLCDTFSPGKVENEHFILESFQLQNSALEVHGGCGFGGKVRKLKIQKCFVIYAPSF
jgi:hypothetical protein